MATKQQVQKRRVQAQRRADAQAAAASRKDRRRRLIVGGIAGTLAIAMVASLGVGFIAATGDDDDPAVDLQDIPVVPEPIEIAFPEPGAAIVGDTPCPSADGSQARTTSFETAPPVCIDDSAGYEILLRTSQGDVIVDVDTSDESAANLFVTNSRYGVYDDVPFWLVVEDGLLITGDAGTGDVGFTVDSALASRPYGVGDVIMWSSAADAISSQFAIVTSEVIAETLNAVEPAHPIVGTIADGQAVLESILDAAGTPGGVAPVADIRVGAAIVTETAPA